MRRFDKKRIIEEANQRLENTFINSRSFIFEQSTGDTTTNDSSTGNTSANVSKTKKYKDYEGIDKFNLFVSKYKLEVTPQDKNEAYGEKILGTDFNLKINFDGTTTKYEIQNERGEIVDTGEIVSFYFIPLTKKFTLPIFKSNTLNKELNGLKNLLGELNKIPEAYEIFKRDYKLDGDDKEASGVIPGSEGQYDIKIKSDNTYEITDSETGSRVQIGTFKSKGLFGKHIELTPNGTKDVFKMDTILSGIKKKSGTRTEVGLYNNFKTIIENKDKIKSLNNGGLMYVFRVNNLKKGGASYSIVFTPTNPDEGKDGDFKLTAKIPTEPNNRWIKNSEGTYVKYGKTLTLTNPKTKVSIDEDGTIDSGLMTLLKTAFPNWENYGE